MPQAWLMQASDSSSTGVFGLRLSFILRQVPLVVAEWLLQLQPSCLLHYTPKFNGRKSPLSYHSLSSTIKVSGLFSLAQIGLPAYRLANHCGQGCDMLIANQGPPLALRVGAYQACGPERERKVRVLLGCQKTTVVR